MDPSSLQDRIEIMEMEWWCLKLKPVKRLNLMYISKNACKDFKLRKLFLTNKNACKHKQVEQMEKKRICILFDK